MTLMHHQRIISAPSVHHQCIISARPDQTRQDQTRPDQTRPDQTRPEKTRPEKTRKDFNLADLILELAFLFVDCFLKIISEGGKPFFVCQLQKNADEEKNATRNQTNIYNKNIKSHKCTK